MTAERLNYTQYAKRIGRTRQYVSKLVALGVIPAPDKKIDPKVADKALKENRDPGRPPSKGKKKGNGKPRKAEPAPAPPPQEEAPDEEGVPSEEEVKYAEARRRLEYWKGEEKRIEVERLRGKLVESDAARSVIADLGRNVIETLYSLQDRIAGRIDIKTQRLLRKEIDRDINRIADAAERAAEKMATKL